MLGVLLVRQGILIHYANIKQIHPKNTFFIMLLSHAEQDLLIEKSATWTVDYI